VEGDRAPTQVRIQELYPGFSGDQLKEAEENLRRYVEVALQIHQGAGHSPRVLDGTLAPLKMEERSNPSLKS
jgi:hypothetical protein